MNFTKRNIIIVISLTAAVIISTVAYSYYSDEKSNLPPCSRYKSGIGEVSSSNIRQGKYNPFGYNELNLTEEQERKIFDIETRYRKKCFEYRSNNDMILSIKKKQMKEVRDVLTESQRKILERSRGVRGSSCCGN